MGVFQTSVGSIRMKPSSNNVSYYDSNIFTSTCDFSLSLLISLGIGKKSNYTKNSPKSQNKMQRKRQSRKLNAEKTSKSQVS